MANAFKSIDQLPITLNADEVAMVLGISRAKAYTLMLGQIFNDATVNNLLLMNPAVHLKKLKKAHTKPREAYNKEEVERMMEGAFPMIKLAGAFVYCSLQACARVSYLDWNRGILQRMVPGSILSKLLLK